MFERYYLELLGYVARSVGDRDRAADVVQEAYARVLALRFQGQSKGEGQLQSTLPVQAPRALLYRAAKNIVIDQHRRDRVRDHRWLDDSDAAETAAPAARQPEALAESRQTAIRLLATIDALPPRCKEAFVLFKFDGMPQAEIAQRMGISLNMVEKHVMSGMQACRRCLGPGAGASPSD